ncbi:MAG: YafY family protein [Myxococcales bacterium]|nr:YafY family protein [Myxococcales bacterium]
MRRADRLFQIVQLLRSRRFLTAHQLAERLEVSERTIYRDIQDLGRSGVPILGEAGVGYRLDRGFDLPPLMFNLEEVEALVLGVRMVERWGDSDLRSSARSILDKVEAVLPEAERHKLHATALFAMSFDVPERALEHLRSLRKAIGELRKVELAYRDQKDSPSRRVIRPLGLYFWGKTWTVGAYCELREDFRNFRLDRIDQLRVLQDGFELSPPVTLEDYARAMTDDH